MRTETYTGKYEHGRGEEPNGRHKQSSQTWTLPIPRQSSSYDDDLYLPIGSPDLFLFIILVVRDSSLCGNIASHQHWPAHTSRPKQGKVLRMFGNLLVSREIYCSIVLPC